MSRARFGSAGMHGLRVETFELDEEAMNIDVDGSADKMWRIEHDLFLFGGLSSRFHIPLRNWPPSLGK